MKNNRLFRAIGEADEKFLAECEKDTGKKFDRRKWVRLGAVAACLCLIAAGALYWLNGATNTPITISTEYSIGDITFSYIDPLEGNPPSSEDELAYLTEQEMFDMSDFIFRGTVISVQNVCIESDRTVESSFAVIQVQTVYRGDESLSGQEITMRLPYVFYENQDIEDSETVSQVAVGVEGIFLATTYDETDGITFNNGNFFAWKDMADYGWAGDGTRFGFLMTEHGLVYATYAYESLTEAEPQTIDDVEVYVMKMLFNNSQSNQ